MSFFRQLLPPFLFRAFKQLFGGRQFRRWQHFWATNTKSRSPYSQAPDSQDDIAWYFAALETYRSAYEGELSYFPIFGDRFASAGTMSGHYFHQDLFVAQEIFRRNPEKHIDIGSRQDGFVAHVAAFRPIEIFDIRPQDSVVRNISFKQRDLMRSDASLVDYCDSISSLHSVEHFGLGRYGDPVRADGHLVAFENISAMLKVGGHFYFSVPIGPMRTEFNAHRIFDLCYLVELVSQNYLIESFSYVDDDGNFHPEIDLATARAEQNNFGCRYGCGIFVLQKTRTVGA